DRDLRERGSADRAEKEKAYLKSELDHYGVSVPETRAVVRATLSGQGLNHDEIIELARSLWVPSRTSIDLPRATRESAPRPRTARRGHDGAHPVEGPPRRRVRRCRRRTPARGEDVGTGRPAGRGSYRAAERERGRPRTGA